MQRAPVKGLEVHFANIAPDVLVGDLLKTTRASQIFTVFGQPDVRVERQKDGAYIVELRGVDIYDPMTGETQYHKLASFSAPGRFALARRCAAWEGKRPCPLPPCPERAGHKIEHPGYQRRSAPCLPPGATSDHGRGKKTRPGRT
ncbi:MAG: hypothetical protein ACUVV0_10150 [Anaerolineae bacterium]